MVGNLLSTQRSGNRPVENVCHENQCLEDALERSCVQRSNIMSLACKTIKQAD
jgi:hypothetical protein